MVERGLRNDNSPGVPGTVLDCQLEPLMERASDWMESQP
jgi:hypothetical protein